MAIAGDRLHKMFVELGLDTGPLENSGRQVDNAMGKVGKRVAKTGKAMTAGLTAPIALAGGAAVKLAADFEKSFARMEGLVGVSRRSLENFESQILRLGPAVGKGPQELADAMFFVTSAGLRGQNALDALEQSARASAAGLGETKIVADAVTSAMNAYGPEVLSAADATDTLVATVRYGKAEADAIANSIGSVIPLASEMGVEFDQVGATIAALTRIGAKTPRAITSLQAVMSTLQKPTKEARTTLSNYGFTVQGLRDQLRSGDVLGMLQNLSTAFEGNEEAMAKVFPNVRALRGVLGLVGNSAEEAREIFDGMADSTGATAEAFGAVAGGPTQAFNQALSAGQALLLTFRDELGGAIVPLLNGVRNVLTTVAGALEGAGSSVKSAIVAFLGMTAAIGPVLGVVGTLMQYLPMLSTMFKALAASTGIGAVVAAGVVLYQNWERIAGFLQSRFPGAIETARSALQSVAGYITAGWQKAVQIGREALVQLAGYAGPLLNEVAGIAGEVFDFVLYRVQQFTDEATSFWETWGGTITGVTKAAFGVLRELTRGTFSQIYDAIRTGLSVAGDTIGAFLSLLTGDWAGAWDHVKSATATVAKYVGRAVLRMVRTALEALQSLVSYIPGVGSKMAGGLQTAIDSVDGALQGLQQTFRDSKDAAMDWAAGTLDAAQQVEEGTQSAAGSASGAAAGGVPGGQPTGGGSGGSAGPAGMEGLQAIDVSGGLPGIPTKEQIQNQLAGLSAVVPDETPLYRLANKMGVSMQELRTLTPQALQHLSQFRERLGAHLAEMGNVVQQGANQLIGAFAEGLGGIAAGTKSWADVGNDLLGVVGGMLGKLGKLLIAFGTAGLNFQAAGGFFSFLSNPIAAIGAGALLVAAGAAIKGALSSGGSAGGSAPSSRGRASYSMNANRREDPGADRGTRGEEEREVRVVVEPRTLPSGDVAYSAQEGGRRLDKYGTELQ